MSTYLAWLAARAAAAPFGGMAHVTCPPPLDIAWVWHVHRLAPLEYARTCAALGAFVAPAPGVGFAFSAAGARGVVSTSRAPYVA